MFFSSVGMTVKTVCLAENKPIVLGRLEGSDPKLPSIILNSHYDVVCSGSIIVTSLLLSDQLLLQFFEISPRSSNSMQIVGASHAGALEH